MRPITFTKIALVSLAMAGAIACGGNNRGGNAVENGNQNPNATTPNPPATTPAAADANGRAARAITVTGCLQQGSGRNTFILTTMNEPGRSVGTSGQSAGDAVGRQQMKEAERAYNLEAKGDVNLRDLVGRQVKVTGTLAESADLPTPDATSGRSDRDKRPDIKASDLAKIDVTEATATGTACGASGKEPSKSTSRKSPRRRG